MTIAQGGPPRRATRLLPGRAARAVRCGTAGTYPHLTLKTAVDAGTVGLTNELDFRVLGPLAVAAGGRHLPLGGAKQRAVLALLLLHANEVVPADRLIDDLWGESP